MLEARLLGQFELRFDGRPIELPSRPLQSLLAYLMVNSGTAHRREQLAGLFWPDVPDEAARRNLRQALYTLRKAIEPNGEGTLILADELTVCFNSSGPFWLDLAVFAAAAVTENSSEVLVSAARAYQGQLLPGFYDEWAIVERQRLEVAFDRVMGALLEWLSAARNWQETIAWAEHWIAHGHAPEPAYRAEMIAYWGLDNLAGVGASYRRCEETLARELGVVPADKTVALFKRLAKGLPPNGAVGADHAEAPAPIAQPTEESTRRQPEPGESPFKGLQYFGEEDARLYFGREELTAELTELVKPGLAPRDGQTTGGAGANVVLVVGASGSGKSSLLRAGLVPAMRDSAAGSAIFLLTPTAHPLEALASHLIGTQKRSTRRRRLVDEMAQDPLALALFLRAANADTPGCSLLLVDQLEELFTACRAEAERRAFIDNVLSAAEDGAAQVVLALRADFYGHCGEYPRLRSALTCCQVYVGPMSAREMRRAIELPAARNGWSFEPGLVDLILRDAGGGPGALPLLSHALLETWKRRSVRMLTLQGYAEAHGVRGAIAKTADAVYYSLTPQQRALSRSIFLRLTELGEGTEDTRRRASFAELAGQRWDSAEVDEVLDILTDARLITVSDGTVEVAHEALIREWATLRGWLDEDREGLKLHRHLTETARAWEGLQRDPGELYRGGRLAQALEWSSGHGSELNALEQAFLNASSEWATRDAAEREAQTRREAESARQLAEAQTERAETQQRTHRRLRSLLAGLAGLLILAVALAAFGWRQQQRVRQETQVAESRTLASIAMANLNLDPQRSALLAIQAEQTADSAEARQALQSATLASHALSIVPLDLRPSSTDSVFSPDGSFFALTGTDAEGQVVTEVYDVATARRLLVLPGALVAQARPRAGTPVTQGAPIWPRVSTLLTLSGEGERVTRFTFWEIPSGHPISSTLAAYPMARSQTQLNPDGTQAAVVAEDGSVDLWATGTATRLRSLLPAGSLSPSGVAFDPWNQRVAVYGRGQVRILDLGPQQKVLTSTVQAPAGMSFGPYDGIAVSDLGVVSIYDGMRGEKKLSLPTSNTGQVLALAYSPDKNRLATAASDGTVKIWNANYGSKLLDLQGHTQGVVSLAFNPRGDRLATVGLDQTLRFWEVSDNGGSSIGTFFRNTDGMAFTALALSPDGAHLAATSGHGTLRVWNLAHGELISFAQGGAGPQGAVAFSPDNRLLVWTNGQRAPQIREILTGRLVITIGSSDQRVGGLAFSPDGQQIATLDFSGAMSIWAAESGELRWSALANGGGRFDPAHKLAIVFSPDGKRLVASGSKSLRLMDAGNGRVALEMPAQDDVVNALAFDPAGRRLAVGLVDGEAGIWDVAKGAQATLLAGHTAAIETLAFSLDGKLLATGSSDNSVKVWDASSGAELLDLPGHTAEVTGVSFTPDGKHLVTSSRDGSLRIYALDGEDLIAIARTRLVRWWTEAECKRYLPGGRCPPQP